MDAFLNFLLGPEPSQLTTIIGAYLLMAVSISMRSSPISEAPQFRFILTKGGPVIFPSVHAIIGAYMLAMCLLPLYENLAAFPSGLSVNAAHYKIFADSVIQAALFAVYVFAVVAELKVKSLAANRYRSNPNSDLA